MATVRIRLGYAAIALDAPEGSPNRTVREATLAALPTDEARRYRLRRLAAANLHTTLRILRYNVAEGISVYRLTSRLIPFATHPRWGWDWQRKLEREIQDVRRWVQRHRLRLSVHLDHFVVLNSSSAGVRERSLAEVRHQARLLGALAGDGMDPVLVTHVGARTPDRARALDRFVQVVAGLEPEVKRLLAVENDDVSFDPAQTLAAARRGGIPMVLDWHHARVNPSGDPPERIVAAALETWPPERRPKLHLSSPASEQSPRDHADDIRPGDFDALAAALRPLGRDCDVLLEAKAKDRALKALAAELAGRPGYRLPRTGEIEVLDQG